MYELNIPHIVQYDITEIVTFQALISNPEHVLDSYMEQQVSDKVVSVIVGLEDTILSTRANHPGKDIN